MKGEEKMKLRALEAIETTYLFVFYVGFGLLILVPIALYTPYLEGTRIIAWVDLTFNLTEILVIYFIGKLALTWLTEVSKLLWKSIFNQEVRK